MAIIFFENISQSWTKNTQDPSTLLFWMIWGTRIVQTRQTSISVVLFWFNNKMEENACKERNAFFLFPSFCATQRIQGCGWCCGQCSSSKLAHHCTVPLPHPLSVCVFVLPCKLARACFSLSIIFILSPIPSLLFQCRFFYVCFPMDLISSISSFDLVNGLFDWILTLSTNVFDQWWRWAVWKSMSIFAQDHSPVICSHCMLCTNEHFVVWSIRMVSMVI